MKLDRVLYFGTYHRVYARNSVLIKGLESAGVEVVEARIPANTRIWQRPLPLLREGFCKTRSRDIDAVILPALNQLNIAYAKLVSTFWRIPLIFDPFSSTYDSFVLTRKTVRHDSFRAHCFWWVDWLSLNWPDALIADTAAHARYYVEEFGVKRPIVVAPIGADTARFKPLPFCPYEGSGLFRVLFWGTFIPLQGVEFILEAARICLDSGGFVQFDLIGAGDTFFRMQRLAEQYRLSNVRFWGTREQSFIIERAKLSHVCLGIFGNTDKTQRVVPNKLYEALAMGKPVISARTPATDERLRPGVDYHPCEAADGPSLARAILSLQSQPGRLCNLAHRGSATFQKQFSEKAIGERLVKELRGLPV